MYLSNQKVTMTISNYDRYLGTYSGKKLLEKHSLDEYGAWSVHGEDPNCDFGGYHHMPYIGTFEGTLREVITFAVEMGGFWNWGAGGDIRKAAEVIKVADLPAKRKAELQKKLEAARKLVGDLTEEVNLL